ncbi:hypothetical protein G4228_000255 [Cervus hanglu yarkandensis]|nr:hypothetical protein G4228_000255 [Cervus hanglu yarkandensis]
MLSHPSTVPSPPLLSLLLWGALLWAGSLPDLAWGTETFTLGVLGPWDCDSIFAQAHPSVAAQLAVDQATQNPSLMLGSRLASVVLPTGCDSPSALATFLAHKYTVAAFVGPVNPGYCPAAAVLAQGQGKTLFSWACGDAGGGAQKSGPLWEAYDAVLTISLEFSLRDMGFEAARADGEVSVHLEPEQVSLLFGIIYDAVVLLAQALNLSESHGAGLSGAHLGDNTGSLDVAGFNQRIRTDKKGRRLAQYVILDTDGRGSQLVPTHTLDADTWQVQPLNRAIHFPGGVPPARDSNCWFDPNTLCIRAAPRGLLALALACVLVLAGGALICLIRLRWQAQACGGQMPGWGGGQSVDRAGLALDHTYHLQKLHVDSVSGSRSVADSGSLRSVAQGSARSLPAPQEPANMALYQGEWVWLKRFEDETAPELWPSCLSVLRKMRELWHKNITTFLGFFVAGGVSALVLEHCARSSLEDLLRNEALRLDWTFKASLLLDLIHGVQYLHHRCFPHGHLKSRNCVVDGSFVLKVADHGYAELLDAQSQPQKVSSGVGRGLPEELLRMAPELLWGPGAPGRGTLRGDTFSIGIILQEVLTGGPPYGSPGLPAEEIIRKVVSPPPRCQPLVSPDRGPPECIQLMKQCWEEAPEDRPNLDQIYSQFKSINQGKKTSVADSMLRMLERSVTEALKMGVAVEPEYFDQVTIYFSDILGFTTVAALSEPIEMVGLLNDLYTLSDEVLGNHDVYKVETIGDAYMVASGLTRRNGSQHAAEITNMALDILSSVGDFRMRHAPTVPIHIRAGLHSGMHMGLALRAGVAGLTMPRYCLFGDTVNTASRMESTGPPYRIRVSRSTVHTLLSLDEGYKIDIRGQTEIKGKGFEETYWLLGKAGFLRPLPTPLDIKPG